MPPKASRSSQKSRFGSQAQPIAIDSSTTDDDGAGGHQTLSDLTQASRRTPRRKSSSQSRPSSSRQHISPDKGKGRQQSSAGFPNKPRSSTGFVDLTLESSDNEPTPRKHISSSQRRTASPVKMSQQSKMSNLSQMSIAGPSNSHQHDDDRSPSSGTRPRRSSTRRVGDGIGKGKGKEKEQDEDPLLGTWGHPKPYEMPQPLKNAIAARKAAGTLQAREQELEDAAREIVPDLSGSQAATDAGIPLGSWGNPIPYVSRLKAKRSPEAQNTGREGSQRPNTRSTMPRGEAVDIHTQDDRSTAVEPDLDPSKAPGTWGNPIPMDLSAVALRTAISAGESSHEQGRKSKTRSETPLGDDLTAGPSYSEEETRPLGSWGNPIPMDPLRKRKKKHATTRSPPTPDSYSPQPDHDIALPVPEQPATTSNLSRYSDLDLDTSSQSQRPGLSSLFGEGSQAGTSWPKPGEWGNPIPITLPIKRRSSPPLMNYGSPIKRRSTQRRVLLTPEVEAPAQDESSAQAPPPEMPRPKRLGPSWVVAADNPTLIPSVPNSPPPPPRSPTPPATAPDLHQPHFSPVSDIFPSSFTAVAEEPVDPLRDTGAVRIDPKQPIPPHEEAAPPKLAEDAPPTALGGTQLLEDRPLDEPIEIDDSDLDGISEMGQQDQDAQGTDVKSDLQQIVNIEGQTDEEEKTAPNLTESIEAPEAGESDMGKEALRMILERLQHNDDHMDVDDTEDPLALTSAGVSEQDIQISPLPSLPSESLLPSLEARAEVEVDLAQGVAEVEIEAAPLVRDQSSTPSIEEITPEMFDVNNAPPPRPSRSVRPPDVTPLEWIRARTRQRIKSSPTQVSEPRSTLSSPILSQEPISRPVSRGLLSRNASSGPRTPIEEAEDEEGKMTREEWVGIVEAEGVSDVELLLDPDEEEPDSGPSSTIPDTIDTHLHQDRRLDPTQEPPEERRGSAKREFNSTSIDYYNSRFPLFTKNPKLHRAIFEAFIHEKELESGEITVAHRDDDSIDKEGPPPDFEFEYSNDMLYHPDVPDPEQGLGCGCDGPCDPNSRTCTCLKRQQAYFYDLGIQGFAYDERGLAKELSTPIWECGDTCGCPPNCINRVIQKGRKSSTKLEIFKTRKKGWGVRARNVIPRGTFIGIYAGEIITEEESEARGELYSEIGRTYLFDLDGWQIRNPPPELAAIDPRLAEIAEAAAVRAKHAYGDDDAVELYNAYSVDAFHYGYTRYFNHSCDPNLEITQCYVKDFHPERPLLVIFARRDVRAKEELCISYKGTPDESLPMEPEPVLEKKRKGKGKRSKTSASAHVSVKTKKGDMKENDANRCYCGAKNCDGTMFNL